MKDDLKLKTIDEKDINSIKIGFKSYRVSKMHDDSYCYIDEFPDGMKEELTELLNKYYTCIRSTEGILAFIRK